MSLLVWITLAPLMGALALAFLPIVKTSTLRLGAMLVTLFVALLAVILWQRFDAAEGAAQMLVSAQWFGLPDGTPVHFTLGVDGISLLMVVLTACLMPLVVLSTAGHVNMRVREFLVWLLVMEAGMLGVFLALDLVLFYFFWEVSLVPLYFILGIWGGERRLYATVKFFLYTLAGSLVMLIAAIALIYQAGTCDVAEATLWAGAQPLATQLWLFAGFALAFAIKVPLFPFHTWLADAHTEAPTAGSLRLAIDVSARWLPTPPQTNAQQYGQHQSIQ
jgi:NADH-quinone oxidoreductase subunit M